MTRASTAAPHSLDRSRPWYLLLVGWVAANWTNWISSFGVHTVLLLLIAGNLGWSNGGDGDSRRSGSNVAGQGADEAERSVGIVLKAEQGPAAEQLQPDQAVAAVPPVAPTLPKALPEEVPQQLPVELTNPNTNPLRAIGPGGGPVPSGVPGQADLLKPAAAQRGGDLLGPAGTRPGGGGGDGLGEASFFGLKDRGSRFVYVLDCSGSMEKFNAIGVAKAELNASLQTLASQHQFQVIFYNNSPREMRLTGAAKPQLYWATDINRTQARQYISSVVASEGTDHLLALRAAFKYSPEVIYVLTDVDSRLDEVDLRDIAKRNNGRARIHCVEFGSGPHFGEDNFLKRLARQNGGSYTYRDVTKFAR